MKKRKLDKRNSGYGQYTHYVEFRFNEDQNFFEIRNWCWETFGPSTEFDIIKTSGAKGDWCWIFDQWRKRILFKSEKEYNWFCLKWGDHFKKIN